MFPSCVKQLLLFALSLLMHGWASAEEASDSLWQQLNLNGSLRAGYYGASRNLDGRKDVGAASLWLQSAPRFSSNASIQIDGWIRNDDSFRAANKENLRECYFNYTSGDADWRVGKQIIVWGRADAINPTDNLTPRNYTLLTPENDDQRLGGEGAKMSYHLQDFALTAIWLPRFTPNVYPYPAQHGIFLTEQIPHAGQGALKLDHSGGEMEWSASYFNGIDLSPDMKLGETGSSGTNLILQHRRIRVLGIDAAAIVGRYALRAEAAYTWTDNSARDPLVKEPFLYAVLGGDRTLSDNFNINLQYYFRRVTSYQDPQRVTDPLLRNLAVQAAIISNQLTQFQHGFTMRISNKWMNETLEGEIAGVVSLTQGDIVLKPKLIYAFNDQFKGTLGADIYRGGSNTFYGRLRDNSSLFVEMKYSF